jgi:uncharacterized membrane protein YdjX (TVP38/TMEM64 family)
MIGLSTSSSPSNRKEDMDKNGTNVRESDGNKGGSSFWRPLILLAVIVLIIISARVFNVGDYLGSLQNWIKDLGPIGPLVFILIYAVAVVAALPGSALTVFAGAIFGSVLGIIVVSAASTLGASLAFLVSRYFARKSVEQWLSTKETFRRLDEMTQKQGWVIVALTRLVPIFPFNLLNFGFGLTKVGFWTYVFWSWLCMLPMTVVFVVGTDAVVKAISSGEIPWILIGSVAVALVLVFFLVRFARTKLMDNQEEITS